MPGEHKTLRLILKYVIGDTTDYAKSSRRGRLAIHIDSNRGRKVAELLHRAFATTGIHGNRDMPEDKPPKGVSIGSLEHLLFITLTVSIDYQRDAPALWESARRTYEDPETRYLFTPSALHETPRNKILDDMQRYKLSKKIKKDADIWRTVGVTFHKKWGGDPRHFLESCAWSADRILKRLRSDTHPANSGQRLDYPYLRGDKIGPLWLRMLRDNVGLSSLTNLDKVPIPVDIHVARASLTTGIIRGRFREPLTEVFEAIRTAWSQAVRGLSVRDRPMIALDVDEPLWHLSKSGCSKGRAMTGECAVKKNCEAREFCIPGKVAIDTKYVEVNT
jgi:hypothetical protein